MKVDLHPLLKKLSGKFKGLVFVAKNKKLVDNNTIKESEVYIRSLPRRKTPKSVRQDNLNKAFKILTIKFKELKADASAYETWKTQAKSGLLNKVCE